MGSGSARATSDDPVPGLLARARELADSFDRAADRYAGRPGYPAEVYQLLVSRCGLGPGTRVVEIGPGVGQATRRLVELGARVTAVEPGPALAARLRSVLAAPAVEVVVSRFEDAPLPEGEADLVAAATSFHWVDPQVGVAKTARLLRAGGWLALWWTVWGDDERTDALHEALVPVLRARAPHLLDAEHGTAAYLRDLDARAELVRGVYGSVERHQLRWEGQHDPAQLRALFATFAGWIALEPALREELLDELARIAAEDFAGTVRRPYQTIVYLAQR